MKNGININNNNIKKIDNNKDNNKNILISKKINKTYQEKII